MSKPTPKQEKWEEELKRLMVIQQSSHSDFKLYHSGHYENIRDFIRTLLKSETAKAKREVAREILEIILRGWDNALLEEELRKRYLDGGKSGEEK